MPYCYDMPRPIQKNPRLCSFLKAANSLMKAELSYSLYRLSLYHSGFLQGLVFFLTIMAFVGC